MYLCSSLRDARGDWPMAGPDDNAIPMGERDFFTFCGAFGFIFNAGGWLMMTANRAKAIGAAIAAMGPLIIVLASHDKAAAERAPLVWSAAAIVLAALDVFALERLAKAYGGFDKAPGLSASFSLGAAASVIVAVLFAFTGQPLWGAAALALLIPAMVWLEQRFHLPALRFAVSGAAAIVAWLLGPSRDVFFAPMAHTPLLNPILPVYATAALGLWSAAWLYRRDGAESGARIVQALEAAALVIGAFGMNLEIRHIATGAALAWRRSARTSQPGWRSRSAWRRGSGRNRAPCSFSASWPRSRWRSSCRCWGRR